MYPVFVLFPVIGLLLAAVPVVRAGANFQVDSSNATELQRTRGEAVTVMGRVVSSRMQDSLLLLVLDGGHLKIMIGTGQPGNWQGKLIELQGNVEEVLGAREGEPALKIFLRTADRIRVIAETPAGAVSQLVVRQKPENLHRWFHQPPGAAPSVAQLAASRSYRDLQAWMRGDGTKATISFDTWKWRQRLGPDLKSPEWVVAMRYMPEPGIPRWFYPEDLRLTPADEERLRVMLWKQYEITKNESKDRKPAPAHPVEGDALTATEGWVDRIKHWGESPLLDDPKAQRLPGPGDFGNLPDLRKLTEVKLRRASPLGRQEGKLVLLDWAMTAGPGAAQVPARIRWEDGVEETVPALDVFPNIIYKRFNGGATIGQDECGLIYMKDWTRAKLARQTLPEGELKIRAVRQFLKYWWDSPMIAYLLVREQDQKKQEEARKAAAAALPAADSGMTALNAPSRFGYAIEFPGLPPAGYKELGNPAADRTQLKPVVQEVGKQRMDDTVANMVAALLWWDAAGVMPLPEKLGKRRREEMLLTQVERYLRGGFNDGRQQDFCYKFLDGHYFMQLTQDRDYSPANLARFAVGHHTVMLHLSVWDAGEYRFPLKVLVHTCSADGSLIFSTWGEVGTARLKKVSLHLGGKRPVTVLGKVRECYELELTGSAALMNYLASKGYRLVLDDWQRNYIEAVTPWAMDPAAPPVKK